MEQNKNQKHHIVPKGYLKQWINENNNDNKLNIYTIKDNNYIKKGVNWKGFWRKNYNIMDDDLKKFLPEEFTADIDSKGLNVIKKLNIKSQNQLSDYNRSVLSFYIALQYIRTSKNREEVDKMIEEFIKLSLKEDIVNNNIDKIFFRELYQALNDGYFGIKINNIGHSKQILKIDKLAEEIFKLEWIFLITPKNTSFITSDNPCFTISSSKISQRILSKDTITLFPIRPDVCIFINPKKKSYIEKYIKFNKKEIKEINENILKNSYNCIITKNEKHLKSLVKNYDYKNHKQSKKVATYETNNYTIFNFE